MKISQLKFCTSKNYCYRWCGQDFPIGVGWFAGVWGPSPQLPEVGFLQFFNKI